MRRLRVLDASEENENPCVLAVRPDRPSVGILHTYIGMYTLSGRDPSDYYIRPTTAL